MCEFIWNCTLQSIFNNCLLDGDRVGYVRSNDIVQAFKRKGRIKHSAAI